MFSGITTNPQKWMHQSKLFLNSSLEKHRNLLRAGTRFERRRSVLFSTPSDGRFSPVKDSLDFFQGDQAGTDNGFHRDEKLLNPFLRINNLDDDRRIHGNTESGTGMQVG